MQSNGPLPQVYFGACASPFCRIGSPVGSAWPFPLLCPGNVGRRGIPPWKFWIGADFKPVWHVQSCITIDAWLRFKSLVSRKNFFDGAELSIECRVFAHGEAFQRLDHHFPSQAAYSCQITEMLRGKLFLRNEGRSLGSLESPFAAFFASSSAFSVKSWW